MARRKQPKRQKAEYGQGSIYADKGGRWYYQPPRDAAGNREPAMRCADAEAAEVAQTQWLARRERRQAQGIRQADIKTLHEWIGVWWREYKAPNLADTTQVQCSALIEQYILGTLADGPLDELSSDTLVVWRNMLVAHISIHAARRTYGLLHEALDSAVQTGKIVRNPLSAVDMPRKPAKPTSGVIVLTDEQIVRLLDAADGERAILLYMMTILGMRRGEALGLRWRELVGNKLSITGQVQTLGSRNHQRLTYTKTKESRDVLLTPEILAMLETQRALVAVRRLRAGAEWVDNDLIFPGKLGANMVPDTISDWFERRVRRLELPRATIHSLRHSAIARMRKAGVDMVVRHAIFGHVLTTHEQYDVVTDAEKLAATEAAVARLAQADERHSAAQ